MKTLTHRPSFDALLLLAGLTVLAMLTAGYFVFAYAPTERTMGIVQKIFYFHVPSAIAAYFGFFLCCGASVWYLLKGDVRADVVARAGAEVGVLFCVVVLVSGPLWARKAWGTFWTGEPRLMLTLVLMLIFTAYLIVRGFGGRNEMTRKIGAVLGIIGVVDIPLVRYSVSKWRGNHPRVITGEGGGISPEMETALMISFVAIALLFVTLLWLRIRVGLAEEDVERYHRALSAREGRIDDLALAS